MCENLNNEDKYLEEDNCIQAICPNCGHHEAIMIDYEFVVCVECETAFPNPGN